MPLVSFGPRGSELPGVLVNDSVLPLGGFWPTSDSRQPGASTSSALK